MFSILPLQLATNLFVAERPEDLNKFYGLDSLDTTRQLEIKRQIERASPVVPKSVIERGISDLIDVKIEKEDGRYVVRDPPNAKNIVIYESTDQAQETKPGDLCIVIPNGGNLVAWYQPAPDSDSDEEETE